MSLTINPLSEQLEEQYGTKIDAIHQAIQPILEMAFMGNNGIQISDSESPIGEDDRYRTSTDEEASSLEVRFVPTEMDFFVDARQSIPPQVAAGLRKAAKRLLRAARRVERVEDWR